MADMEEEDYADSVDEEEYLEIDSPMEPRPDNLEEDEELHEAANLLGPSIVQQSGQAATQARSPPKIRQKVKVAKEDRTKMLDYPRSLPYECESLEDFDQRLALIQQRLVECVATKECVDHPTCYMVKAPLRPKFTTDRCPLPRGLFLHSQFSRIFAT